MSKKKIEPTDAMVTSAHSAAVGRLMTDPMTYRRILRAALNHPDARGLFTDEDDRPWEPLNVGDPLCVGDEVRRVLHGITITAVVGRVDDAGDPWAAEGRLIGVLEYGTWYVRHPAPELPTEDGAVIVPADGREHIEAVFDSRTWRAKEAVLGANGWWRGVWRREPGYGGATGIVPPECITPGTWKVEGE